MTTWKELTLRLAALNDIEIVMDMKYDDDIVAWFYRGGKRIPIRSGRGVSADGANTFRHKGFVNKQILNNHLNDHRKDYPNLTPQQYEKRALELLQSPVGGNILGHADKDDAVVRYNVDTKEFAKGHPKTKTGIYTMFKPKDGIEYYKDQKRKDIEHGGREFGEKPLSVLRRGKSRA